MNSGFTLKRNKKSGNFSILRKDNKRIRYIFKNVYLPFGREEYNEKIIINAIIDNSNNYNRNLIITLNQIAETFIQLKDTDLGKYKYGIDDKTFFSFMKETDDYNNKKESDENAQDTIKKYQIRTYLKYGAKVTHSKFIGELNYDQLKGKNCNLNIELGSLWINNESKHYGINIYITHITVNN